MVARTGRAAAGAVLTALPLVIALGACSSSSAQPRTVESDKPVKTTSDQTSSAPSASTSPPSASDVTQINLLAHTFYLEYVRAANTGDVASLRSLTTSDCNCHKQIDEIANYWASGKRIVAPKLYQIVRIGPTKKLSATTGFTNVIYRAGDETDFGKTGKVSSRYPGSNKEQADSLQVRKVDTSWKVAEIDNNG